MNRTSSDAAPEGARVSDSGTGRAYFPETRWSLVLDVQQANDAERTRSALDQLCQTYWFPIYSYVRRTGLSPHDAEDRTQAFFEGLVESGALLRITPEKGRMRTYLLATLKRGLIDQWRHDTAAKRGGTQRLISIDAGDAEARFVREIADGDTPERAFERNWARALLTAVYVKLERYYADSGRSDLFTRLRQFLAAKDGQDSRYTEIAAEMGLAAGTVRTTVHRMRARFREILEGEIRETVSSEEDAVRELQDLKRVLSGG